VPQAVGVRRRQWLSRLHRKTVSAAGVVASCFIPGLAFYLRARFWGVLAMGVSALLIAVFFAELGRTPANMAFGLLLAIHATGLNYLAEPWLREIRFRNRVMVSMLLLIGLAGVLYMPARAFLENHFFTPWQMNNRVLVIQKFETPPALKRGDWIAYNIAGGGDHGAWVADGSGLGPILAVAGDHVRFTPSAFEVNGTPQARLGHMPEAGEFVVPQKCWFLWPEFTIGGHGNVAEGTLSSLMLRMGTISEGQFVGKPFKRWFWHHQFSP
jgi:hypothetical protein